MPGIAGCISLTPDLPQLPDVVSWLTRSLMHEARYTLQQIPCPEGSVAVIVNPEIDPLICGIAEDVQRGVSLGFYGEFHGYPFNAAASGDEVAAILLRRYLELENQFPMSLDGSYVIFVADRRRKQYLIFNDYYASRPVFYGMQGGRFYFSPEAKGVARMPGFDAGVDHDAMVTFLVCSSLVGDHTFYKNVKPLLPGTVLTIEEGKLIHGKSSQYAPSAAPVDRGADHYEGELQALMLKSVDRQLRDVDSAFVPLSGGIDSRAIAGCVHRLTPESLHTVSWGVNEDVAGSDTFVAREVAGLLHCDHRFARRSTEHFQRDIREMIYRTDGLITDSASHSSELSIMRRIREEFSGLYLLRGEECFGHAAEPTCDAEALGQWGIAPLGDHLRVESLLNPSKLPEFREHSTNIIKDLVDSCPSESIIDRRDYFYFAVRLFHYHSRSAYCKRTVIDVRNPWLDRELLEFLAVLPARHRIDRDLYKRSVRALFPELMAIPPATRNSLENWSEVVQKDRTMQQFLKTHLIEKPNSLHEILNPNAVRELYEQAIQPGGVRSSLKQRTMKTTKNFLRTWTPGLYQSIKPKLMTRIKTKEIRGEELLFRMLILKLWFDQFVDGEAMPEAFRQI
jgi:asparagine synthetase B (glutamine-hydrolysing)